MNKICLTLLMLLSCNVYADNIYVAYRWMAEGASSYTDSWAILETGYDTSSAYGMQRLTAELSALKKTKTVVIYYVRELHGKKSPLIENSGTIGI